MPGYQIKDFTWLVRSVFRDVHRGDTKKVWVLGAGASIESGICGADTLAHRWGCELLGLPTEASYEVLLAAMASSSDFKNASTRITQVLKEPGPDDRRLGDYLAQSYFDLYSLRFSDPEAGYNVLRREMDGKLPSVGYMILAQLLSTRSNLVITVNFDNLIADALFLAGHSLPLVLDHENIAHLAGPINQVPLVCKIHRDLLKEPKSREAEVQQLDEKWEKPLTEIFKYYSPIFIGYGGNDRTLMTHLTKVEKFLGPPIWLHYTKTQDPTRIEAELSKPITEFLNLHGGVLVPYSGFDRLMSFASSELGLENFIDELDTRWTKIREGLAKKRTELAAETGKSASTDPISMAAVESVRRQQNRGVSDWVMVAESEEEPTKQLKVYDQAVRQHPESSWLLNNRGATHEKLGNTERALKDFRRAAELDPTYSQPVTNLGVLKVRARQFEDAERYFDQALELDPNSKMAWFNKACASALQGDAVQAISHLEKSIRLDASRAEAAEKDHDFDLIRDTPEFKNLLARYRRPKA